MIAFAAAAALVGAGLVQAAPNPTEPSSTSVFNAGGQCTIKWDADATATWTKMNIQLMTGDNWNMKHITTVAQDIDATASGPGTFTYTCPEVVPYSAIYFYQFSTESAPKDLLWTTRWTLASPDGATTPPTEDTQPNGDKIPWGTGALADPSKAVPAPAYLGNAQAGSSATGSSTGSVVPATSTPVAGASSTGAAASAGSLTTSRSSTGTRAAATGSSTTSAAAGAATANGALGAVVPGAATLMGAVLAAIGLF